MDGLGASASKVSALVGGLAAGADTTKAESLYELAQLVDSIRVAGDDDAAAACSLLRDCGVVECLVQLVRHPMEWMHQTALHVLGSLASDTIDPLANDTRAQLKATAGGFESLLDHLWTSNTVTLAYALTAVCHTCAEPEYVLLMQQRGAVVQRLQLLAAEGDSRAAGCAPSAHLAQ